MMRNLPRRAGCRARRRLLAAVAVVATGWSAVACGIPTDAEPHAIQPPQPYQDFASASPQPSPPQTPTAGTTVEVLYLIRDGSLVEVTRPVDQQPSIEMLIEHLTTDPTEEEQAQGLGSALTVPSVVEGVSQLTNGIVTVALGLGLDGITPDFTLLAIAQIVCTLDAHPDVVGVTFTRDGGPWPVARADGTSTEAPLTALDYRSLFEPL